MNKDLICWPSLPTLATATSRNERTVQKALRELEDANVLSIDVGGGRRRTSTYAGLDILEPWQLNGGDTPAFDRAEDQTPAYFPGTPALSTETPAVGPETPAHSRRNGGDIPPEVVSESGVEGVSEIVSQCGTVPSVPEQDGAAGFFTDKYRDLVANGRLLNEMPT